MIIAKLNVSAHHTGDIYCGLKLILLSILNIIITPLPLIFPFATHMEDFHMYFIIYYTNAIAVLLRDTNSIKIAYTVSRYITIIAVLIDYLSIQLLETIRE